MLEAFAYNEILGLPFIVWGGIATFILFMAAGSIPLLRKWKIASLPYEWHFRIAYIALILGIFHAVVGLILYL